jgi:hypothetical protein
MQSMRLRFSGVFYGKIVLSCHIQWERGGQHVDTVDIPPAARSGARSVWNMSGWVR